MKDLIRRLCEVYGPCGQEEAVRALIETEIADVVDEMRTDALGNLIAVKRATQQSEGAEPTRIMLAAHMDEIGAMISHIDERGFLRITNVGYVLQDVVLGARMVFADGTHGALGLEKNPIVRERADLKKVFVDVGVDSADEVHLKIGDVGVFRTPFAEIGDRMLAPNFDDRIGCAVLIQILRELKESPNEIIAVFTVQEEVGLRGATTAAFGVAPDVAIALDVTPTGDIPEVKSMPMSLGKGPGIKVKDTRMIAHPGVKKWLVRTAEAYDIPYQLEVLTLGSTDAAAIQVSREGVPTGAVSIPSRYVHQPSQMVDYTDVQNVVRLLVNGLSGRIDIG